MVSGVRHLSGIDLKVQHQEHVMHTHYDHTACIQQSNRLQACRLQEQVRAHSQVEEAKYVIHEQGVHQEYEHEEALHDLKERLIDGE